MFYLYISATALLLLLAGLFSGGDIESGFTGPSIDIVRETATPLPVSELGWDIEKKLEEAEEILGKLDLKVSTSERTYTEEIATTDGQIVKQRTITDHDRDIGLALLSKKTGDIKTVVIRKEGDKIIAPEGFPIEMVTRSNGIKWNRWNTQYRAPDGYIVIMNNYPDTTGEKVKKTVTDSRGRKKTITEPEIENFIYAPYSAELHVPELVEAGREYIVRIVEEARTQIRNNNVPSRAYENKFLASVDELKPEFFHLLPLIEQTDLSEFILDPLKTSERVLVLIGANKERAFVKTGSPAGAYGWVQFTKPTYDTLRTVYPSAGLMKDFKKGAADHLNSMVAAVLLYDYHLERFIHRSGDEIADDERLEEYLAAAYNGGPSRILNSLMASIGRSEWTGDVHAETKGYIVKLRTMRSLNIMR